jgi:glycosyltransferase involved in cell wall biosynthesis
MLTVESRAISVVMPVHNAAPYLDAAVESILGQSFQDFEFVILDDASTDGSTHRLREWAARDPRIRLLEEAKNLGPALSSQRVAIAASAPLVARMDADDVSHPDRLLEQVEAFARFPEAGVIATLCDFIDTDGRTLRGAEPWRLVRRSPLVPFAHGAMMYCRAIFDRAGGYRQESEYWEDQDLVTRMAALAPVLIIPRALYRVRLSATSTRAASNARSLEQAVDKMYRSTAPNGGRSADAGLPSKAGAEFAKVDPRVFISLGSQALWAGGRPRLFRRLLERGRLGLDFRTICALVWTAWASLCPGSLRGFLRALLLARNAHAANSLKGDGPVRWRQSGKTRVASSKMEDGDTVRTPQAM